MAGQRSNYSKRSHSDPNYADNNNGGGKRRYSTDERDAYPVPAEDDTVYRYLCPGKRIGSIMGRGGEIVKQLRADTHAKIRIGETIPGCDERVVTIFSSPSANTDTGDYICPAQDALFKVHHRIAAEDEAAAEEQQAATPTDGEEYQPMQLTIRMLVPSDQIGSIIGKGGQIIQGIRTDTGAQIRILKAEHLPLCAIFGDELLQITGEPTVARNALHQVSVILHDNPSQTNDVLSSSLSQMYPPSMGAGTFMPPYGGYNSGYNSNFRDESTAKNFGLRMLCISANIGAVIGKGGGIIKQIRQDSGAHIKVDSSTTEDDCIISISARECFEDAISPAVDAALRLQMRCSEKTERETGEPLYNTRLLVPSQRIGCLLGRGGSIITEMRRTTCANIRIHSKENLPKVASEDDEMVQISGVIEVARTALMEITRRLRANFFDREDELSGFPPHAPFHAIPPDSFDGSKYRGRENKSRGYGYSSSYGASADYASSEGYGNYASSQGGGSSYGSYGGYAGRSGSSGLSGLNSHAKHHDY